VTVISLISLKPNYKIIGALFVFIFVMNLVNILLYWLVKPDIGSQFTSDKSTILIQFSKQYFISLETLWYLSIRQMKMISSFMISIVFILSITPSEIASGFYGLGLPYKLCTVVSLAFRYIPQIANDYENINISLQARGMELDKRRLSLFKRLKHTLYILIPLIISSFDRVGNVANALDLRAYGLLKKRTYYCEHPPTKMDHVFRLIALSVLLFSVGWIIAHLVWFDPIKMWFPFEV